MVRTFTSSPLPAYERGVELGRVHAVDVARVAGRYAALFARRGEPGFDAAAWAVRFGHVVGDLAPDLLAELRGVAAGAGVPEVDVLAVAARTEILAKADPRCEREYVSECSAVLVRPPTGSAFGAQTWDWYATMADGWFCWRIPSESTGEDGSWLETVTEYGVPAKIGVSSRGLGVLLTILHHEADDSDRVGLPVHVLARLLLERCTSVAEAMELCRRTPVAASTSLTVVDRDGGASIELFPGGPGVVSPTDGLLARTNHFLDDAAAPGDLTDEASYPTTFIRRSHLDTTLRAHPPAGPDDVLAAMRHHHPDGGVCRHDDAPWGDAANDADPGTATLATVVIEPGVPRLRVWAGGPCQIE